MPIDPEASSSDQPLVSIVLCAWRPRPDWLREAVASALAQRDCQLEVVVVDDGSPTPVADFLVDMEDARLRVLRVEHEGLASARNAGVRAARGEFLRFADADDVFESGSTARLLSLAGEAETISYGATLVCDTALRPLAVKSSRLEGWVAEQCLLYRFDVKHMSMLFPRSVVERVGVWDTTLRQCQDWDYVLRALEMAPVRGEQRIETYYRRHESSASANVEGALLYESLVVKRYFERHPELAGTSLEREAQAKLLMVRAKASPALGKGRCDWLGLVARAFWFHPRRAAEELGRDVAQVGARAAKRLWRRSLCFTAECDDRARARKRAGPSPPRGRAVRTRH